MTALPDVWRAAYTNTMSDDLTVYRQEEVAEEVLGLMEMVTGTHEENLVTLVQVHAALTGYFDRYGIEYRRNQK